MTLEGGIGAMEGQFVTQHISLLAPTTIIHRFRSRHGASSLSRHWIKDASSHTNKDVESGSNLRN